MTELKIDLLARMMDRFAHEHWNDSYSHVRGGLSVEGDRLLCTVGGETVGGHAGAPLLFVTGA